MRGTFIDLFGIVVSVLVGGMIRKVLLHKGKVFDKDALDAKFHEAYKIIGALALFVGILGMIPGDYPINPVMCIISIVLGGAIGTSLHLQNRLSWNLNMISQKFLKEELNQASVDAVIDYTILSLAGAMAITGPMTECLNGDTSILITKTILDSCCGLIYGCVYGFPILFSSVFVFAYQGAFALITVMIQPILTPVVIGCIASIGSLLIVLTGLNLLGATKVNTMDYTPAILLPILLQFLIR